MVLKLAYRISFPFPGPRALDHACDMVLENNVSLPFPGST